MPRSRAFGRGHHGREGTIQGRQPRERDETTPTRWRRTMEEAGLDAARLSVVGHGTRASFRRRVMDAMRQLVPASGAFICFGTDDARAFADSSRLVDGTP